MGINLIKMTNSPTVITPIAWVTSGGRYTPIVSPYFGSTGTPKDTNHELGNECTRLIFQIVIGANTNPANRLKIFNFLFLETSTIRNRRGSV
jgi:hypothetical protein